MRFFSILIIACLTLTFSNCKDKQVKAQPKLKALILDGENNHGIWPKTTFMMKSYLEETGLFEVDINRKAYTWIGPHYNKVEGVKDINELLTMYPLEDGIKRTAVDTPKVDSNFNPKFENYDVVISNLGWKSTNWSDELKTSFETYMKNGGGLVVVHAANNAWGDWDEFNKMIGLGAWGGRDAKTGPYIFYNDDNEVEHDPAEGLCASHGPQYEFQIQTRAENHPIMKGLPKLWLHTKDELYDRMRGPGENMTILATAYSDVSKNAPPWKKEVTGTGRHEPMLIAVDYGEGRIFHSALGHMDYSFECAGFITTFQRGVEWAATGNVTQDVPEDFPTADSTSARKWVYKTN
ncbi:ThuA domain-containing protein [Seonamhaeicola marinus]|uniref:ThuA domain-containing protein n=1 Tax=Seonamhaeicola marinus TaxID=1912246 RepID=A0A5D0I6U5_9FLAO|nr:ThuA domain-containing protein [Seonamhaeicola marinus]TYA78659.1 ThuA domain-containing protein [Seonamhaeicola marinus]